MDTHEKSVLAEIADKAYQNKSYDRQRKKSQDKIYAPLNEEEAKQWTFYCSYCRKDFIAIGYKIAGLEVFYKTVHNCGRECIRRWTERVNDEYYNLSEDIKRERSVFEDDMLSPYQNRFRVLYEDIADKSKEDELKKAEEKVYT